MEQQWICGRVGKSLVINRTVVVAGLFVYLFEGVLHVFISVTVERVQGGNSKIMALFAIEVVVPVVMFCGLAELWFGSPSVSMQPSCDRSHSSCSWAADLLTA